MIDLRPIWEWILDGGWLYLGIGYLALWALVIALSVWAENNR